MSRCNMMQYPQEFVKFNITHIFKIILPVNSPTIKGGFPQDVGGFPMFYDFFTEIFRIHGAGIYANIWGIFMVNVTIYSIHGSYGFQDQVYILLTCLIGLSICYTGIWAQSLISATSFLASRVVENMIWLVVSDMFIFSIIIIWDNPSHLLIFFRGVETTKQ